MKVHLALFTVSLVYAINYILAKMIMPQYIMPYGIVFLRVLGATALFWFFAGLRTNEKIKSKKDYLQLAYCAIFGVILNQLLFFKGLSITTAINASIILVVSPILVLVVSSLLIKEKITFVKLLGIALGCLGALLLIGGKDFSFESDTFWGDFFIFLNSLSYAIYLVMVKPLMQKYKAITVVKWIFLMGCVGVLPFGFSEFWEVEWEKFPIFAYEILAFIIIGATFLVYLLNVWALQYVSASLVGIYMYLQPVLTTFLAIFLGNEIVSLEKIIYSILIFSGVYLVGKKTKPVQELAK